MTSGYTAYDDDSVEVDPGSAIFQAHLSRYWWARETAGGASVLDCACGKGYGTFLLAGVARSALGIDLNEASLAAANRSFSRPNLEYRAHDVLEVRTLGRRFDLITAFEIIEHIDEKETGRFLAGLAAGLEPGGRLLLSTPNHTVVRRSGSIVPVYHINNFTPRRLRRVLRRHFERVTLLGQFRAGGPFYQAVFTLDAWNLRHAAGSLLGLRREEVPPDPAAAHPEPSSAPADHACFETPPPSCRDYRFSRWHWRQAGITVAICERPVQGGKEPIG